MIRYLVILILFPVIVNAQIAPHQNTVVQFEGKEAAEIPVQRAYAHPPIATSDCMAAVAAGMQTPLLGATVSFSKYAKQCNCRENSKQYEALGEHYKAVAIMDWCNPEFLQQPENPKIEYKYPISR